VPGTGQVPVGIMNRKLIFHICVLGALICLVAIIWTSGEPGRHDFTEAEIDAALVSGEAEEDPVTGDIVFDDGTRISRESGWDWRMILMILMLVVIAGYSAIFFIVYVLPAGVQRFAAEMLGSEEQLEEDAMHDARALFAQGDFHGAVEAYRDVARLQPENRFPWIEIAKIQRDKLEDPDAAIRTLRDALESYEWRINDAAFFMFRLAELYEQDKQDLDTTVTILKQVVEMFPDTRHSANATHRLRELSAL